MARILTSGFENNSKTSGLEFDTSSIPGGLTLVTTPTNGGAYALQVQPASNNPAAVFTAYTANQNTDVYSRVWLYIDTALAATSKIMIVYNATTSQRCALQLTAANQLQLLDTGNTQVGGNSPTLSLNTWYCVELGALTSGANPIMTARLNDVPFASAQGLSTAGWSKIYIGALTGSTTGKLIFDDFAVNDGTGSFQNSFPGRARIVRATPNAAGDVNTFGTAVGGTAGAANNFTRVNQITPDGTTTYNASNAAASDFFAVTVPTVPSNRRINCVVIGGQYANITGADATTAFKWQIKKTTGGTVSQSSAIIPNSTTMIVNTPPASGSASGFQLVMYKDPDGNDWTPATIASMQIGYALTAAGTNPIAVSDVYALVDYDTYSSFFLPFTASLGLSGQEPKQINIPLTAGITLGGGMVKGNLHSMSASLGFVGASSKFMSRKMFSNLNLTGGMTKLVTIPFSGVLGLSGLFTRGGIYPLLLEASVSFVGAVSKTAGKSLGGSVSFVGGIGRSFGKTLTAVLGFSQNEAPSSGGGGYADVAFGESDFGEGSGSGNSGIGELIVQYIKSKGLYFTGALGRVINKNFNANLGFIGTTNKRSTRRFTGTVSFVTAFANPLVRMFQGAVGFAGTLSIFLRHAKRPAPIMAIRKARNSTPRISIHKRKP